MSGSAESAQSGTAGRRKKWIGIGAVVAVIAVIIIASLQGSGPRGEKVYVEPVRKRDIEALVSASGEIDPKVKVNISSHVIGKIERIYFAEGAVVKRGDRLVDLEKIAFTAQRDRMSSEVANRRIEVNRARLALRNAESQYSRAENLQRQGIQADEAFEQARLAMDNARAMLASAQESVRQAEAALKQAQEDLARTTIVAPIDGKIVQLNAHEGEVVITGTMNNPGSIIMVLADLSEILVEAEVAETEVVRVRLGQTARVNIDAVGDKQYSGQVVEIGSSAALKAGSSTGLRYFTVKVAIRDADDRLRPGMTAQVEIITESARGVPSVPVQSVVERAPPSAKKKTADKDAEDEDPENPETRKYVFVVKNGRTDQVEVTTGISNATHVAITSGLKGDEQVVSGPFRTLRSLKDDQPVQPEKERSRSAKEDDAEKE